MPDPSSGGKKRTEAFGAYYFTVNIGNENVEDNFFRSCTGLKANTEVVEIAEGGVNATTHKLIGRTKFDNLVLKQGFTGAASRLWKLFRTYSSDASDEMKRFNGTIIQKGPGGTQAKWTFENAWVCKWEGPDFDASKNEVSIESIEIAHEGLTKLE